MRFNNSLTVACSALASLLFSSSWNSSAFTVVVMMQFSWTGAVSCKQNQGIYEIAGSGLKI